MHKELRYKTGRPAFGFACLAVLALTGCATDMAKDQSANMMSSGIAEARGGAEKTQSGVDQVNAGSRSTGMGNIDSGMNMMMHGVADMQSGMTMMSSGMMMNCVDGGSGAMMSNLQAAMDEMHQGQSLFASDAATSDAEGIVHMQNGLSMMNNALDQADSAMRCMGHASMM